LYQAIRWFMQIAIITGPTYSTASSRIAHANSRGLGIELRLDLFQEIDIACIQKLRDSVDGKVVFTLRSRRSGGGFLGNEEKRYNLARDLLALNPDYFDFEWDTDPNFLSEINTSFPNCKIILSYHNFLSTPKDLDTILNKMLVSPTYAYKICTTANSISDSYKMLRFVQKIAKSGLNIIGICMGEYGRVTRADGLKAGNYLNYTILHTRDKVAPGLTLV
jgi:3-dehydroquinate dehydratase/shikimate dehydrogenase